VSDRSRIPAALIAACAALLPALLALRLPDALDGQDGVNFALALADYDPVLEQPHFPGYPLYIALCRLFAAAGASEPAALALPACSRARCSCAMVALGRVAGLAERTLALAALLLVAQPLVWLEGRAPPDLLGTSLAWAALAGRAFRAAGGAALGLAPARAPTSRRSLLVAALRRRLARASWRGSPAASLWLPGFARASARRDRGERASRADASWCGTPTRSPAAGRCRARAAARLRRPLFAVESAISARAPRRGAARVLVAGLAPYALWVLLGQNLAARATSCRSRPRSCGARAGRLGSTRRRGLGLAALAVSLLATGGLAGAPHPDGRALAARVAELCRDCAAVFAGPEVRLLEHYGAGGLLLYRRASVAEVRRDLAAWPELSGPIGLTSTLADSAALSGTAEPLAPGQRLYRIDAAALR
jgi:hypothetical protein